MAVLLGVEGDDGGGDRVRLRQAKSTLNGPAYYGGVDISVDLAILPPFAVRHPTLLSRATPCSPQPGYMHVIAAGRSIVHVAASRRQVVGFAIQI